MEEEQEKLEKLVKMLRRSSPVISNPDRISENVIMKIRQERTKISVPELIYEFIFGWVYIGWMRRSMVAAATCMMLVFGYQQAILMRKVDALSSMSVVEVNDQRTGTFTSLDARFKIYNLFGRRAFERKIGISKKKELDKFIESVNDLQEQYRDVFRMIETDPMVKKYIDDRLKQEGTVKPKI